MDKGILSIQIKGTNILRIFFLVLGLLLGFLAYKEMDFRITYLKDAKKVPATVVSVEQKQLYCGKNQCQNVSSDPGKYGWAKIDILYTSSSGQNITAEIRSILHNFLPGQKNIQIYTNDTKPETILVANPIAYWFNTFFYTLGALLLISVFFIKTIFD